MPVVVVEPVVLGVAAEVEPLATECLLVLFVANWSVLWQRRLGSAAQTTHVTYIT